MNRKSASRRSPQASSFGATFGPAPFIPDRGSVLDRKVLDMMQSEQNGISIDGAICGALEADHQQ
jgi:hypothetical protein